MPEDYMKDFMSKTHGIRSGEPKRPESLIEVPSMVPEVPEVSLCFNQEKCQPRKSNKTSSFELPETGLDHQQNEMLLRIQHESYNTWKAKNAQALHNIAGGSERIGSGPKRATNTTRFAGLVRKQHSGKGNYTPPVTSVKHYNGTNGDIISSEQNCSDEYNSQTNGSYAQLHADDSHPVERVHTGYPLHSFPVHHVRDPEKIYHGSVDISKEPPKDPPNLQRNCGHKDIIDENVGLPYNYHVSDKLEQNNSPIVCPPNYRNKLQCPCEKQKHLSLTGNQYINEPRVAQELRSNNMQFVDTTKMYSSLDARFINSHLSSFSDILNIQKEQISILCQEISSQKMLISTLLEEVKQIQAVVSPNMKVNHDISPTKKIFCQNSSCEQNKDLKRNPSEDSVKFQMKQKGRSDSNQPLMPSDNVEKRSVGVMTSFSNNSVTQNRGSVTPANEKDKPYSVKNSISKSKKHKKPNALNSPSPNKNKLTSKKELVRQEEKRKPHPNQTRKTQKEESNKSSPSDDSLSLDEAAVVVRGHTEPGDFSPQVSIHVNMPDYSASSAGSDSSDSSDSEDEGQESGSEGESSDPQIGWTFYDRVVGQVNNMLKKTSKDPRQEYTQTQRRNEQNVLYQCGDYETENNWSKRVTFDGPPLEDSDNNAMQMPRYHHFRTDQDYRNLKADQEYRMPGGPGRMQDFMVCDYANGGNNMSLVNGNTNVSFATYRYYQRHQLLPPPPPPRVLDQVLLDHPQMRKKKNKSRKSDKTPPSSKKNHRRRNGESSSNILDVSALKPQPKLL